MATTKIKQVSCNVSPAQQATLAQLQPHLPTLVRMERLVSDTKQYVPHVPQVICALITAWLQFYALQVPLL
jgi:hypothetical protein